VSILPLGNETLLNGLSPQPEVSYYLTPGALDEPCSGVCHSEETTTGGG